MLRRPPTPKNSTRWRVLLASTLLLLELGVPNIASGSLPRWREASADLQLVRPRTRVKAFLPFWESVIEGRAALGLRTHQRFRVVYDGTTSDPTFFWDPWGLDGKGLALASLSPNTGQQPNVRPPPPRPFFEPRVQPPSGGLPGLPPVSSAPRTIAPPVSPWLRILGAFGIGFSIGWELSQIDLPSETPPSDIPVGDAPRPKGQPIGDPLPPPSGSRSIEPDGPMCTGGAACWIDEFQPTGEGYQLEDAAEGAFETAQAGGKHAGFLKNYQGKTPAEIQKGIGSLEKQIAEHQAKIAHPEKALPNWSSLDPRQQQALVNQKWPSDIQRQTEQMEILKGLLGGGK